MTTVFNNIVQDKQEIKYQLASSNPSVAPAAKLFTETIEPVEVVTKVEQVEYDGSVNVFILNSPTYGVLGTNKLGDSASTTTLFAVLPKDNIFVEYFGQNTYIDTVNSTGSLNTTDETYTMTVGQKLQSEVICYLREPITQVTFLDNTSFKDSGGGMILGSLALGTSTFGDDTVSIEVSNDNGVTWNAINEGDTYTFSTSSNTDKLKYRVLAQDSVTISEPIILQIN